MTKQYIQSKDSRFGSDGLMYHVQLDKKHQIFIKLQDQIGDQVRYDAWNQFYLRNSIRNIEQSIQSFTDEKL